MYRETFVRPVVLLKPCGWIKMWIQGRLWAVKMLAKINFLFLIDYDDFLLLFIICV